MKNVGNSSRGRSQGVPKIQGTHIYGASRGYLCDSTAFLFKILPVYLYSWYNDRRSLGHIMVPIGKPTSRTSYVVYNSWGLVCVAVNCMNYIWRQNCPRKCSPNPTYAPKSYLPCQTSSQLPRPKLPNRRGDWRIPHPTLTPCLLRPVSLTTVCHAHTYRVGQKKTQMLYT